LVKIAARALLLALPLMPAAGACAQPAPDTEKCASAAGIIGDRIAACTRAVASGLLSTRKLAEALRSGANQWRALDAGDRAFADCDAAIRLKPREAGAYLLRGMAWYYAKRDNGRAIADFTKAILLDPQLTIAYFYRGIAWKDTGDADHAIADFSAAILLDPRFDAAYIQRALAWNVKGDNVRATADIKAANQLQPRTP
jgi:tetratricopeptide (TPR) repeat protein